jgi:hypothetical protein
MKTKITELILAIAIYLRCPFRLGGEVVQDSTDRNLESHLTLS